MVYPEELRIESAYWKIKWVLNCHFRGSCKQKARNFAIHQWKLGCD